MSLSWAYLYLADGADPQADRIEQVRGAERTLLVPVPDIETAARAAVDLVEEGVELIELCGAFGIAGAAKVIAATEGRVPVGAVGFGIESLQGAAAYQRSAEALA